MRSPSPPHDITPSSSHVIIEALISPHRLRRHDGRRRGRDRCWSSSSASTAFSSRCRCRCRLWMGGRRVGEEKSLAKVPRTTPTPTTLPIVVATVRLVGHVPSLYVRLRNTLRFSSTRIDSFGYISPRSTICVGVSRMSFRWGLIHSLSSLGIDTGMSRRGRGFPFLRPRKVWVSIFFSPTAPPPLRITPFPLIGVVSISKGDDHSSTNDGTTPDLPRDACTDIVPMPNCCCGHRIC